MIIVSTFCMTACTSWGVVASSLEKLSRERACQLSSTGSAKRAPSSSCSRASVLDRVAAWLGEAPLVRWALQTADTTESTNKTAASNWLCCSCIPVEACRCGRLQRVADRRHSRCAFPCLVLQNSNPPCIPCLLGRRPHGLRRLYICKLTVVSLQDTPCCPTTRLLR